MCDTKEERNHWITSLKSKEALAKNIEYDEGKYCDKFEKPYITLYALFVNYVLTFCEVPY
jgi:hypothetical protein